MPSREQALNDSFGTGDLRIYQIDFSKQRSFAPDVGLRRLRVETVTGGMSTVGRTSRVNIVDI